MTANHRVLLMGGLLALATLGTPPEASAQRSGVEIWANNCGRCHTIAPANRYTAKDWQSIGIHMMITSRLTSEEGALVIAMLKSGAMDVVGGPSSPQASATHVIRQELADGDAAETFASLCKSCHGEKGKGDGVAAVAFNPKPTDFADESVVKKPDNELASAILNGKGGMPGFKGQLSQAQVAALVEYIRELSGVKTSAIAGG